MKKKFALFALVVATIFNIGCGTHQIYETSKFNNEGLVVSKVALSKGGLTNQQIKTIAATKPPSKFPLNLAVIFVVDSQVSNEVMNEISYEVISSLKKIDKIGRLTVIPNYIVPENLNFSAIQELGIRSLSEYVLVINLSGRNVFQWTAIVESKFELQSDIEYLFVDSFTTAMLTSDRLISKQVYTSNMFSVGEEKKARSQLFAEQGNLLEKNIDRLLNSSIM